MKKATEKKKQLKRKIEEKLADIVIMSDPYEKGELEEFLKSFRHFHSRTIS